MFALTQHITGRHHAANPSNRTSPIVLALVSFLVATPALVKLAFYPAYPGSDDAFIHMAVARHILAGKGWGVESIDAVSLSSSPVFTVLLLPILALGSIGFAQIVFLACACGALALTYVTARRVTGSPWIAVAVLAVAAANVHLWRWSGTVMEASVGFLAVVVIAAFALSVQDDRESKVWRLVALGAVVGVGAQVRFEIGLFLPLVIVTTWLAWRSRYVQSALSIAAGFCAALLPWTVFATAYFGNPVPTTFSAKASSLHLWNAEIVTQIGSVVASGFGLSLLLGVAAVIVVARSASGRRELLATLSRQLLLLGWPVGLLAFYYLKTDGLQSAARYYLPGMATWPLSLAVLLSTVGGATLFRARYVIAAVAAAGLVVALVLNVVQVRPVLIAFNDGYRSSMEQGAAFLADNCRPGDVALVVSDIGVLMDEGIAPCALADGGALASPELRTLGVPQLLEAVQPDYVVQSIGGGEGEWVGEFPGLTLVMSTSYTSHGVATAGQEAWLNIYEIAAN